ncbi:YdeI/OmpD-associated family protein [Algibacter sp.]|uniref:YdeI/OmpD-associated family protein n=1 Tax=Algibacter sp. TaxID=1872428 RepID=UPI003C7931EA
MKKFKATLEILGINPFVFVPKDILEQLFFDAKKDKGHIPICGTINGEKYIQTLVRYKGDWRLYINMKMLPNSPNRIGETIEVTIKYDFAERKTVLNPKLLKALKENQKAKKVFDQLSASKQKEIIKYISYLKSEESIDRNIKKAIGFLNGENSFVGRKKP